MARIASNGTRPNTLEAAQSLQERAREVLGSVSFILLINKHDSAKTGEAVEEAFHLLAGRMLEQA